VYGYDSYGEITSVTYLAATSGAVTYTTTYDPSYHQLTSVTEPLGHVTSATVESPGNTTGVTDPLGNSTTVAYNGQGLPTLITDPLGHATQFSFTGPDLRV
jgi:YD repeat-containing protein